MSSLPSESPPPSIVASRRKQIAFHLLLPTLLILLLTAGLGIALIGYLVFTKIPGQTFHDVVFVNGSLYTNEGVKDLQDGRQEVNLRALLITSLTVRITPSSNLIGKFDLLV